jgi:hypothetical protein
MATGAPQFAASGTERGRGVLRPAVVVEIVPSTEVRPQAATAICSASTTTVASCRLPIDRPINRREVRSIAARERVEVADRELSDSLLTGAGTRCRSTLIRYPCSVVAASGARPGLPLLAALSIPCGGGCSCWPCSSSWPAPGLSAAATRSASSTDHEPARIHRCEPRGAPAHHARRVRAAVGIDQRHRAGPTHQRRAHLWSRTRSRPANPPRPAPASPTSARTH